MTPIKALTLTPAEIYGIADRTGSIEPGKIANLTVTSGDWFDDKVKVKFTFVDGQQYDLQPEDPKKPEEATKTTEALN